MEKESEVPRSYKDKLNYETNRYGNNLEKIICVLDRLQEFI